MRQWLALFGLLIFCGLAPAQKTRSIAPVPTQFQVGRRTFFDFGPPFNYYDIFIVTETAGSAFVERITLTPAADKCIVPARMEVATGSLNESVASLLKRNPCAIPQSALRRELKRKKGSVFSGADVTMRVQCGSEQRLIKSAIFDRDMFDSRAKTPEHTSGMMFLLARLDRVLGPSVMDKPMFPLPSDDQQTGAQQSNSLQEVGAGSYDVLFEGAPDRPSALYSEARNPAPFVPVVTLQSSSPIWPERFIPPLYPLLAKMVRVNALVTLTVDVNEEGAPSNIMFAPGNLLLEGSVRAAVAQWKFPKNVTGLQVSVTIRFSFKCPPEHDAGQPTNPSIGFVSTSGAIPEH
jgi:hypothetical protein